MDWITDQVALGNYQEARDSALLKLQGFRPALSLDGALAEQDATEFGLSEVVSYPLVDGPGNDLHIIRFAVADLRRLAASRSPVLVQCHAGRSRSVAVVAALLMEAHGIGTGRRLLSSRRSGMSASHRPCSTCSAIWKHEV